MLQTDSTGDFDATYNSVTYSGASYFDSGSTVLFFEDSTIGTNGLGYSVPGTTLARSVSIAISNLATATVDFNAANANAVCFRKP